MDLVISSWWCLFCAILSVWMKIRLAWLWNWLLEDIVHVSKFHVSKIRFFLFMSLAKMWFFSFTIREPMFVLSFIACFIFGVMVVLIGKKNSNFGKYNVRKNGLLLVH